MSKVLKSKEPLAICFISNENSKCQKVINVIDSLDENIIRYDDSIKLELDNLLSLNILKSVYYFEDEKTLISKDYLDCLNKVKDETSIIKFPIVIFNNEKNKLESYHFELKGKPEYIRCNKIRNIISSAKGLNYYDPDIKQDANKLVEKIRLHFSSIIEEDEQAERKANEQKVDNIDSYIRKSRIDKNREDLSKYASDWFKKLYNNIIKINEIASNDKAGNRAVNEFCIKLVFCMFAEDSQLFKHDDILSNYLDEIYECNDDNYAKYFELLFNVLSNESDKREYCKYEECLSQFPYISIDIFEKNDFTIPKIDKDTLEIIIEMNKLNWKNVDPSILGSMFVSVIDSEDRKQGGIHYTSRENIDKVINPLFMDNLNNEFNEIKKEINQIKSNGNLTKKEITLCIKMLDEYLDKISSLKFLDPACGCGNFLVQIYLYLREIENEIIIIKTEFDEKGEIFPEFKVNINQFYGIEILDFACDIALLSFRIAEWQMYIDLKDKAKEKAKIIGVANDYDNNLFKKYDGIVCENACRIDWNTAVKNTELSYIVGNPPYRGSNKWTHDEEQKIDMSKAFSDMNKYRNLDYVCAWLKLSSDYIHKINSCEVAFLTTVSVCQGEQVSLIWKYLIETLDIKISFAYRKFKWDNDANVSCIIFGLTNINNNNKCKLYDSENNIIECDNINGYLLPMKNFYLKNRDKKQIGELPPIIKGSEANDGNSISKFSGLILSKDQANELLNMYKGQSICKYIKEFVSSEDFFNNEYRYCLWFADASEKEIQDAPEEIQKRLKFVESIRKKSPTPSVRENAERDKHLFNNIRQPNTDFMILPRHVNNKCKYIPVGFCSKNIIASDATEMIESDSKIIFGILCSKLHRVWFSSISGELGGMASRYTPAVYYNFPWVFNDVISVEDTANRIIEIRKKYNMMSLNELYSKMPDDLKVAHKNNDEVVNKLYNLNGDASEIDIMVRLLELCENSN